MRYRYLLGWMCELSRTLIVHVGSQAPNCPQRLAQPYQALFDLSRDGVWR